MNCEHCKRPIELKGFRPNPEAALYEWWSHVGGGSYCHAMQATPETKPETPEVSK